MNAVTWLLDLLWGPRLAVATKEYLKQLATAPVEASRSRASELLNALDARPGPHVTLGETERGQPVRVPLADLVGSHGLVTAASGGGKTMLMGIIVDALLENQDSFPAGFAGVDGAKSELFLTMLFLIQRRIERLSRSDPAAASKFRRRVWIIDFAVQDAVTEFNFLARWPGAEADAFAGHQVDLLMDVIPDGDALKLAATPLKSLVQLLSEPEIAMSIIDLIRALDDDGFLEGVLVRCRDGALVERVRRQLGTLSKATRGALRRRLDVFTSSESVARMLAGRTAPDFRKLQDEGCIVPVNCAGPNISSGLTQLLNTMAVSGFCLSIRGRRQPDRPFLDIADEAHDLLRSSVMREHLADAGRLSRRYGTHLCLITQNLAAAVPDARLLSLLHTNVGWTWSGRSDPADCAFLKLVLPATGRRPKPKESPFEESRYYSIPEERALMLEEIANLPSRTGYLWLKGRSSEAIRFRTRDLDIPQGRELEEATSAIRRDPTIGHRLSRKEYEKLLAGRERRTSQTESRDLVVRLEEEYRRGHTKSRMKGTGE